jgi:hypothetical protein
MSGNQSDIQRLLCDELVTHGIDAVGDASGIHLQDWPAALIDGIRVHRENEHVVHADLWFHVDRTHNDSAIYCQAVGMGDDPEAAMADAASQWMHNVAPPILSFLNRGPCLGAEWCPNGSAAGFDGWDSYVGPYLLRGEQHPVDRTREVLRHKPLAALVGKEISAALSPVRQFETVLLYVAQSGSESFAEARIGFPPDATIANALRSFPFPAGLGNLISVRQFIFCARASGPARKGFADRIRKWLRRTS